MFTCEYDPKPYTIVRPDGRDTPDRWAESLQLWDMARGLWNEVSRDMGSCRQTLVDSGMQIRMALNH